MADAAEVVFNAPHAPYANAIEAFGVVLSKIKHEILKSRRDWDKHEPKMWSRAAGLSTRVAAIERADHLQPFSISLLDTLHPHIPLASHTSFTYLYISAFIASLSAYLHARFFPRLFCTYVPGTLQCYL